ncbi:MAG: glycosyltransferase family 39 protein [Clostridia bacterium]|nr:glycosyltransferase family 39 protein [Clostridia bacterium]
MGFAWLIAFLFLLSFVLIHSRLHTEENSLKPADNIEMFPWISGILLLTFLLIRLLAASFTTGFPADMSCWSAWGNRLAQLGTSSFYSVDYFCDYPPGYLYILGLLSRLAQGFHLPQIGVQFLLKLPAVFADLYLAVLIFRYAKKQMNDTAACILSGLFLLSPLFFFDSAVWGQIDSILLVFLVLAMLHVQQGRYRSATLYYALAVLIKPQGLILAPIFLLALLDSRSVKTVLLSILTGIMAFLLVIMPFSPAWQEYTGVSMFLHALSPLWMIEKYLTTLASYPYFSVNAFNLYGLLHLNWVELSASWQSALNSILLALGVLGAVVLFLKVKDKASRLWVSSYFLFAFLFTFAFKMHERYLVLPVLFLLFAFLSSKNRKLLYLFAGFSAVGFLNLYYPWQLALTTQEAPAYIMIFPIALAEVVLFLWSIWVIYTDFIRLSKSPNEWENDFETHTSVLARFEEHRCFSPVMRVLRGSAAQKQKKMTRLDCYLLTGIVLVYSLVAYANLGDTRAPQTWYQPASAGNSLVITFLETETIYEIDYYCGVGEVSTQPGLHLSYSSDGEIWTDYPDTVCRLKTVFYWEVQPLEETITAKYLRLTAESTDYMLFEAGFRNTQGSLAEISTISGSGATFAIADEQDMVTNMPTYENSTYFDEIYHPRTAFEHLHMMPYYETTHPPLGKLIMALGVALFGMTPFGWRFMGTLTGILMLPIFYLFLKRLFGRTRYAVLGTLLFAFDFMHFSLTRLATIDSYPVFFILGMYYFMYQFGCKAFARAKGEPVSFQKLLGLLALSGLFMGLGCASKWTAVYAAAGLAVEFIIIMVLVWRLYRRKSQTGFWGFAIKICAWCLLTFVAVPAGIYTLSYLPISMVEGYSNVFEVMWENQQYMLNYHSTLVDTHPYSSPWYTWPFVYKPMWAYMAPETSIGADQIGCISIFQNPLLSWLGIIAFVYSLVVGCKKRDYRVLFLAVGLLAQYLPWALVSRYALQYHFFATMVFLILFVVYAMQDLEQRIGRFGYVSSALTTCCLVLFLLFYPVISGVPVSRFWAETILTWFDSWVFFI